MTQAGFHKSFSRIILAALIIWALGLLVFTFKTVTLKPSTAFTQPATDAVIVLTGGSNRVNTGLDLLQSGKAHQLFITGVDKRVSRAQLLALWGQPQETANALLCCITLEHKAQNTVENAASARRWISDNNIKSLYLVTSEYHMLRAYLEFRAHLDELEIRLYPVKAEARNLRYWALIFGEYHKTVFAGIRHTITNFMPSTIRI